MLVSWCRGAVLWVMKMQLKCVFSWGKKGQIKIHSTSVYLFFHVTLLFFISLCSSIWKYSYYGDSDDILLIELTSAAQHEYISFGNTGDSCRDYFMEVSSSMYSFGLLSASGQNVTMSFSISAALPDGLSF